MKKTYFQCTYNVTVFLVMFDILSLGLGYATKFLSEILQTNQIDFSLVIEKLILLSAYSYKVGLVLLLALIVLVGVELYQHWQTNAKLPKVYLSDDSIKNFLKQELTYESMMTIEKQTVNHQNPVMLQFNKAVRWSVADVQQKKSKFLKVPRTQQAQKLFKEMEDDIRKKFQIEILNITSQLQLEMAISCGSLELNADMEKVKFTRGMPRAQPFHYGM